ncbi:GumC family protein [Sphingomonas oryzagri]
MNGFTKLKTPMDIVGLFLWRKRVFLAVTILVMACVTAFTFTRTPLYSSTSQVMIDVAEKSPISPAAPSAPNQADGVVGTQLKAAGSRPVAAAVVDALGLSGRADWGGNLADPADVRRERAIDALMSRTTVSRDEAAPVLMFEALSKDQAEAAEIANAMAGQFIDLGVRSRQTLAGREAGVLNRQLARLGNSVRDADAALAGYRASHGLAGGASAMGTAVDQQTAALAADMATAQSEAAQAQALASAARTRAASGHSDSVAEVMASPVMANLREQRETLATKAAEIHIRYGPEHPETARIDGQLANIDAAIAREAARITRGLEGSADAASSRAASIAGELNALKAQQSENARTSVGADSLARIADARRTMYVQLAQSASVTTQERELDLAPGHLIVAATPATQPIYPKKSMILSIGAITALASGVLAVLLVEALDSRIRRPDEIDERLGVRHLSSIGYLTNRMLRKAQHGAEPWDYVLARPMSAFAESLRSVRARLLLARSPGIGQVICITSSVSNESKSVLSASLARAMALSGDRVILIDCDLRRNGLAGLLAVQPIVGLIEVLNGDVHADDAIVSDVAHGLDIMPLTEAQFSPKDMFSGGAMADLLTYLRRHYDFIVMDTPPTLIVDDAVTLATLADKVLLAVRWGTTRMEALRLTIARLRDSGADVFGIVLTGVSEGANLALAHNDPHYYLTTSHGYHRN